MRNADSTYTLNVGCGNDTRCDVRLDLFPTPAANIVGDAQHLPFRNGVFSEVYEKNLLEHMPNPAMHLVEVYRIMQRGGRLNVITDNAACLKYYLLGTHTGGYSKHEGKDKHFALFTMEHLKNLFQFSGFDVQGMELVDTDYFTSIFDRCVRLVVPSLSYPRISVVGNKN
jgi:SAM-dependent methyltransferase